MALSNSFSFTCTQNDLIRHAMLNLGVLGEAENPTAQEYNDCAFKLNAMVKQWMEKQDFAPGLKQWQRARGDLFLSQRKGVYYLGPAGNADNWAGGVASSQTKKYQQTQLTITAAQGTNLLTIAASDAANVSVGDFLVITLDSGDAYSANVGALNVSAGTITLSGASTLPSQASVNQYVFNYTIRGQRPTAILAATLRYLTGEDSPLNVMTLQDYELLPIKGSAGNLSDPTAFYYESQFGSQLYTPTVGGPGSLYLDIGGASDVTKHLHIVYLRPIMDMVNPGDNPEYPQQYYDALCWGLSRRIAPMFDAEWTAEMDLNYQESTAIARQADPETTSLYFVPDQDTP